MTQIATSASATTPDVAVALPGQALRQCRDDSSLFGRRAELKYARLEWTMAPPLWTAIKRAAD